MTKINRAFLDKHYNENIFMKNKEKLLSGGTGDSFLALSILSDEHKPKSKEKEKNHGRKETQETCTLLGKISQEI